MQKKINITAGKKNLISEIKKHCKVSLEEVIGLFKKNHHIFELIKNCKQKNIR